MAFIDKLDPQVIDIKFTNIGRELISQGKLNIKYFGLGDSEIDYNFLSNTGLSTSGNTMNILKPVDKNPNLLSFINKNGLNDNLYEISSIDSSRININNTQNSIGFFNLTGATKQYANTKVKNVTKWAILNEFDGSSNFILRDGTTGVTVGDILIIKWINAENASTSTPVNEINVNQPTPYLTYRVISVAPSVNSMFIGVDRNLPNYTSFTRSTNVGVIVLEKPTTGNTYNYTTDDILNATFENNILSTETDFPYWKLTIINTEEIAGVSATNKKYSQFKSATYGGFVSYIQGQSTTLKKLGVIHYSNMSPLNTYGENLFNSTPKITIPTIMWHKSLTPKLGIELTTSSIEKKIVNKNKNTSGLTNSFELVYHDLVDESGYVVGKVFNDLKLFVIEDQELLFALSYKSNRSWSLPNFKIGFDENYSRCATCDIFVRPVEINYIMSTVSFGVDNTDDIIAEAFSGATSIKMSRLLLSGGKFTMELPSGNYSKIIVRDTLVPNCTGETTSFTILPRYQLTVTNDTGYGNVVISGNTGTTAMFVSGTTAYITVSGNSGSTFKNWAKCSDNSLISSGTTIAIVMTGDTCIKTVYEQKYSLIVNNDSLRGIAITGGTYISGTPVNITPVPNWENDYIRLMVSGSTGTIYTTGTTVVMNENKIVTVEYQYKYSVWNLNVYDDEAGISIFNYFGYNNELLQTTLNGGNNELYGTICARNIPTSGITNGNAFRKNPLVLTCSEPINQVSVLLSAYQSGVETDVLPLKWVITLDIAPSVNSNFTIFVTDPITQQRVSRTITVAANSLTGETDSYLYTKELSTYNALCVITGMPSSLYNSNSSEISYTIPALAVPVSLSELKTVTINPIHVTSLNVDVRYRNSYLVTKNMRIRVQNVTKGSGWVNGVLRTVPSNVEIDYQDVLQLYIVNETGDTFEIEMSLDGGTTWNAADIYTALPLTLPYDYMF